MFRIRLATSIVAGVVAALFVLLSASGQPGATNKYGGTLVVGCFACQPDSLDPTVNHLGANQIFREMCQRLYEYADNHGKIELAPVLAAVPPVISADHLSYTVKLRQGIEFNDGTPFNAQAVVVSYQRYVNYTGSAHASDFAGVASVTTSGPYTVVYHLKQRDSSFTGNMYVLSPSALTSEGANFAANPVCVGPFMFDRWTVDDNVTLIKSRYYYKRSAVHLDKIVFKLLTDSPAAAADLEAGDIQVLSPCCAAPITAQGSVAGYPSLKVLGRPAWGVNELFINIGNRSGVGKPYATADSPLAQSAKLRQAFEEAINRSELNRVVSNGLDVPDCNFVSPGNTLWYSAIKAPCTPYDPADARRLVAASGFPTPITVHLLSFSTTGGPSTSEVLQSEEDAVGFNVVLDFVDGPTDTVMLYSGDFEVAYKAGESNFDPNPSLYPFFDSAGAKNYSGYSNPRLDYVLNNALKATSFKARALDYSVAQQILHDDRPVIYLRAGTNRVAYNSAVVTGVQQSPDGNVDLVNAQLK